MRGAVTLALLAVALAPAPAARAYHWLEAGAGGCRWAALGPGHVDFAVDASSSPSVGAALLADAVRARDRWNQIGTARDVLGDFTAAAVDFDETGFGTAWGVGFGASGPAAVPDGRSEIVLDETGAVFELFGLDPADVAGFGATRRVLAGGVCTITDALEVVNGTLDALDRESTLAHELGHVQGLAHSAVGQFNSRNATANAGVYASPGVARDVVGIANVPTMHPFGAGTGTARRTPERDDVAGLSALYPSPSFATAFGAVEGRVTRCGDGAAVVGVSVRAVDRASPAFQVARATDSDGRYRIDGLPPGDYRIVVEALGFNGFTKARLALETDADAGFVTEYYGPTAEAEAACTESLPDAPLDVVVAAGGVTAAVDVRVEGVDLALVVDDTGSMSQELLAIAQVVDGLAAEIAASGAAFPNVALLTYKDTVALRAVTADPDALGAAVAALTSVGGLDCPESANAALLAAGPMLRDGGLALLFTDADSRPDGPTAAAVHGYYRSRGLTASTLLSDTCRGRGFLEAPGQQGETSGAQDVAAASSPDVDAAPRTPATGAADELAEPDVLGTSDPIDTFAEIASETGGVFRGLARPIDADVAAYVDLGVSLGLAAVGPVVGLATPPDAPQGAVFDVALTGLGTHWDDRSRVAFGPDVSVAGVTVSSPTSLVAEVAVDPAAPPGGRDVVVTTPVDRHGDEVAVGLGLLVVRPAGGPEIVGAVPPTGVASQTLDLRVRGFGTQFDAGTTVALGSDVLVNDVAIETAESLVANVSIADDAFSGPLPVTVRTAAGVVSRARAFQVLPTVGPLVEAVSPTRAVRGQALDVTIRGRSTTFEDGVTAVFFGGGVAVVGTSVLGPTELVARLEVAADALLGSRDVRVVTADESAVGVDAFRVAPLRVLAERDRVDACVEPGGAIQLLADVASPFARLAARVAPDRETPALDVELALTQPTGETTVLGRSASPGRKVSARKVALLVPGEYVLTLADAGGQGGCFSARFRIDDRDTGRASLSGCVAAAGEASIPFDATAGQVLRAKIKGTRDGDAPRLAPSVALVAPSGARTALGADPRALRVRDVPLSETGVHRLAIGSGDGLGGCYRAKLALR